MALGRRAASSSWGCGRVPPAAPGRQPGTARQRCRASSHGSPRLKSARTLYDFNSMSPTYLDGGRIAFSMTFVSYVLSSLPFPNGAGCGNFSRSAQDGGDSMSERFGVIRLEVLLFLFTHMFPF